MTPPKRRLSRELAQPAGLAITGCFSLVEQGEAADCNQATRHPEGVARCAEGRLHCRVIYPWAVHLTRGVHRRPRLIAEQTPVSHFTVATPEADVAVCLGSRAASDSLAAWRQRSADLVTYRSLNLGDALAWDAGARVSE